MTPALVTIAPGHFLAPAPAASYARMRAAGCPAGVTSSWRSPVLQAYLYDGWVRRLPGFNYALPPGSSWHETGHALDLHQAAAQWVRAHPEHGWRFTNRSEWWHVDYFAGLDRHRDTTPSPTPEPTPEDDMALSEEDRLQLRADVLEQTNKAVRAIVPTIVEQTVAALLGAVVPQGTAAGLGTDAARLGQLLTDTRIQTARIDKRG